MSEILNPLVAMLTIGLSAGGLAGLYRLLGDHWPLLSLPWRWVEGKPFLCPYCLAGWFAFLLTATADLWLWKVPTPALFPVWMGAAAVAGRVARAMAPIEPADLKLPGE
jgi:hypothetical protein